jgi:hypothetical protein
LVARRKKKEPEVRLEREDLNELENENLVNYKIEGGNEVEPVIRKLKAYCYSRIN